MILIFALWQFFQGESMGQSVNLREQTDDKKEKQTEDISRERRVESQLKAAAQWGYLEDATDPIVAPPDYDIRQPGRVLELQNRDLWLRPTDMSWHLHILMTMREEPFKNYRSRTSEKSKAKEDKIEVAKRQKTKRSDDEWNYADWQPSSWSWRQPMTRTSSSSAPWQQCSSDRRRERSGWRSSGSWQSPFSWQWRTSSTRTFTRAFMTTKITSGCDGLPSFRHFRHLSCFAVRSVRDCHTTLSTCHL